MLLLVCNPRNVMMLTMHLVTSPTTHHTQYVIADILTITLSNVES